MDKVYVANFAMLDTYENDQSENFSRDMDLEDYSAPQVLSVHRSFDSAIAHAKAEADGELCQNYELTAEVTEGDFLWAWGEPKYKDPVIYAPETHRPYVVVEAVDKDNGDRLAVIVIQEVKVLD